MKKLCITKVKHGQLLSHNEQKTLKGGDDWGYTAPADATYVAPAPYDPYDPSQSSGGSANEVYPPENETIGDETTWEMWNRMNEHNGSNGGHYYGPVYQWAVRNLMGE